jgi:hypothetical protein
MLRLVPRLAHPDPCITEIAQTGSFDVTTNKVHEHRTGVMPYLAAAAAGFSYRLPSLFVSLSLVAALALLPVWVSAVRKFRLARLLSAIGVSAVFYGASLTFFDTMRGQSLPLLRSETFQMLAFVLGVGMLLWSRTLIGSSRVVLMFGLGAIGNLFLIPLNPVNPWKYDIALPVVIAALGLASVAASRTLEIATLLVVGGVSAVSDSRSMTSFVGLAAFVVILQWALRSPGRKAKPWLALASLAALGYSAYSLLQTLFLEGALGEAAQQRSEAQLDASGSLIAGGRPELGAGLALIRRQPWGFGSGTVPTPGDVLVAKSGMSALNYDPNNGYVEKFMFGDHFEVHSVLGDVWIRFGLLGAAFALIALAVGIYTFATKASTGSAPAILVFLVILGAWDTFFSPLATSYRNLSLLIAISLAPVIAAQRPRWERGRSRTMSTHPSEISVRRRP